MNLKDRTIYEQFLVKHLMQTNALFTHRISPMHVQMCKTMGYDLDTKQPLHKKIEFISPPRFGKSLWVIFVKATTDLCLGLRSRIGVICNNTTLVQEKIRLIRNAFETNPELLKEYNKEPGEPWTNQHLQFKDGTYIVGFGRGQSTRGWGFDLILPDDIENLEEMKSEVERARTEDWWEQDLITRLEPGGQIVFDQTNSHYLCWANKIWRNIEGRFDDWVKFKFQALSEAGTSNWEDRWSTEELLKIRDSIRPEKFLAEYQGEPTQGKDAVFRTEYIKFYDYLPRFNNFYAINITDPASSTQSFADFCANVTIIKDFSSTPNKYYIVDPWRAKGLLADMIAKKVCEQDKHNLSEAKIEWTVKFGENPYVKAVQREQERLRTFFPVASIYPARDKVTRAREVEDLFYQGLVYFPRRGASWLIDEMIEFPEGEHDDGVDAFVHGLKIAKGKKYQPRQFAPYYYPQRQLEADPVTGRLR